MLSYIRKLLTAIMTATWLTFLSQTCAYGQAFPLDNRVPTGSCEECTGIARAGVITAVRDIVYPNTQVLASFIKVDFMTTSACF